MTSWGERKSSYLEHSRPNGRPVHPACTFKLSGRFGQGQPCSCDKLWDGWDGTDRHLDEMIGDALRAEMRRKGESTGDDLATYLENDSRKGWDGFWSNAENLRCVRGKNFLQGDLDMSRFTSSNWQRALEASK